MIINANTMKEAILEAEKLYKCNRKQLKVYVVEPPKSKLLGIVRMPGKYDIKLKGYRDKNISKQQDVDGYVEIVSGNIKVTNPLQEGRYASIVAEDPNIDVYINDKKVLGATIVTSTDRIEFKCTEIKPVTEIKARLSSDKMQAILKIKKTPGRKYFVKDQERSNIVFIRSDYQEIDPPAPTLEQCLEELKKLNVDPKFINIEKINELISKRSGGSAVVAEGIPPVNGLNSKIKLLFKNASYRNPDFDTEKKVDFMSHTIIPTVNIGDVLAVKIAPAVPGRDGFTVTGEVLKAKNGRDIPLKAGKGTALLDNGTKIVAISPGRPKYKKGVISVISTLVINHDLDVDTGNVHFDGDIVIKGNIAENLKVSAGGNITVLGSIYHADVQAKGNIKVYGKIINSKVSAGLNMLIYLGIIPKLKQILGVIEEYQNVVNSLETANNYNNIRRKLLQLAISRKDMLDKLIKDIQNLIKLSNHNSEEEINRLVSILKDVKTILTSINAKCIKEPEQVKILYAEVNGYIDEIKELNGTQSNVIFEYGQNSFIQASGNIVITNRGCYQTNLIAKNAILFKKTSSVVLGGLLIAGKHISAGIIGSPSGISTYCKVLHRNGKIKATYYYNNTVLNINGDIKVIDSNSCANKNKQLKQVN